MPLTSLMRVAARPKQLMSKGGKSTIMSSIEVTARSAQAKS